MLLVKKLLVKLLPLVVKEIVPIIEPLQAYVFKPNDLDEAMVEVKEEMKVLKVENEDLKERLIKLEKGEKNG